MRIAVVRNDDTDGVIAHSDQPSPERYGRRTVRAVVEALRAGRHFVAEVVIVRDLPGHASVTC